MQHQHSLPAGRAATVAGLSVLALLSACGGAQDKGSLPDTSTTPISCKTAGAKDFTDGCALEWLVTDSGKDRHFLLHHPDGGFRRFILSADGGRINAADGAEALTLEGPADGKVALLIGEDVYRLTEQDLQPPASDAPASGADSDNATDHNAEADVQP
ncbi:MAG: hypothetical protein E2598_00625 [Sphingobium sp.]|nr:hypothetical protein [Sphingobium sp.]